MCSLHDLVADIMFSMVGSFCPFPCEVPPYKIVG